jgi:predicted acyl esterase
MRGSRLRDRPGVAAEIERCLTYSRITTPALFGAAEIERITVRVAMRDGVRLATDVYLPPRRPAPVIVRRTPYGRSDAKVVDAFMALACRGYIGVSQDCRGTGDSEPETWDYYMYESEDGFDCVEWVSGQAWCNGFIGSFGSSYVGQMQWCMAMHPRMSTIVPEVSGLGVAVNTARLHMFCNAYASSVGKGSNKLQIPYDELERQMLAETLATGYFNEPLHVPIAESLLEEYPQLRSMPPSAAKRHLWELYCSMTSRQRARFVKRALGTSAVSVLSIESLPAVFGHRISHDAHTIPHVDPRELCRKIDAPVLMITGWYDWALNDALTTWQLLMSAARESIGTRSRLIITPSAHNVPGYHESVEGNPELLHNHRAVNHIDLLLRWYEAIRQDTVEDWPKVIYYLMAANEWHVASAWPPPEAKMLALYLGPRGTLTSDPPRQDCAPATYVFDPEDPTPTVGGSIVSYVYPPGSVDVSEVQKRSDVLTYTSAPLPEDLDVVGPLRLILYAASTARDTDFCARVSDVFEDGRAIQLQSGLLRARYRDLEGEPAWLEPGRIYRLEIDLWATANRFMAGHRVRVDISSADFPRFDRNTNRAGEPGAAIRAVQTIYHDPERPSHLLLSVMATNVESD